MRLRTPKIPRSDHPEAPVKVHDPLLGINFNMRRKMVSIADTEVAELWVSRGGTLAYSAKSGVLPAFAGKRRSVPQDEIYRRDAQSLASAILKLRETIGFSPSVRGWCYIAEEHFHLTKGEFGSFSDLLVEMRKSGLLPLDICAEDGARQWYNDEEIDPTPEKHAQYVVEVMKHHCATYRPISFWSDKDVYIQLLVEKIDLVQLWKEIAGRFHIPIANARGWSDLHCRATMMRRFRDWEDRGKKCVLLYCGDHDPAGLNISESMMSNLAELKDAQKVNWHPRKLKIHRFGLNADFIEAHGLPKLHNLETSSGGDLSHSSHRDHTKPYVQSYLRKYGKWKVEANALVVRPDAGRKLLLDTIQKYLPLDAPDQFRERLSTYQRDVSDAMRATLCKEFNLTPL
ncbi:hypothetical protein FZ983_16585 [Azospirillum sp. B21]|uniref:hypothetical protein n=1 Tax=Azospirillum sp. B21 TaxID=2607496 RepID=UPI0011ECBD7B|nr:hypothetical protein [Azospirillum sp. B21]KAA0578948.1 hypothetical protein FZ983_16585 [Azospirillum sp. B21]